MGVLINNSFCIVINRLSLVYDTSMEDGQWTRLSKKCTADDKHAGAEFDNFVAAAARLFDQVLHVQHTTVDCFIAR